MAAKRLMAYVPDNPDVYDFLTGAQYLDLIADVFGVGAVFFSSHVLEVVERLCDTVAVIRRGELVALGPTDEVRGSASLEDVFLELVGEGSAAAPSRR